MPTNNTLIMMGLGLAALFMLRNRGDTQAGPVPEEYPGMLYKAPHLAGAAMMAAGEGTAPDAPFQQYSAPTNPVFFFNQGGEMAQVPGSPVPMKSTADEDIGVYPGRYARPELEFEIARSVPPAGTTDISPTTPEFQGDPVVSVTASTIWDQQSQIADANFMPLLAIQDAGGGGINILGANTDISNLSSKEQFRAVNVDTGFAFTAQSGEVLGEYVRGFTGTPNGPVDNAVLVSQTESDPFDDGYGTWTDPFTGHNLFTQVPENFNPATVTTGGVAHPSDFWFEG